NSPEASATRAGSNLTDAVLHVLFACRVLGSEALIHVLVTVEHQLGAMLVQRIPDRPHPGRPAVSRSGAEAGMVEVRDRAGRIAGLKLLPQPDFLRRSGLHIDVAVQDDHLPRTEGIAVVALSRGPGGVAEVLEVR